MSLAGSSVYYGWYTNLTRDSILSALSPGFGLWAVSHIALWVKPGATIKHVNSSSSVHLLCTVLVLAMTYFRKFLNAKMRTLNTNSTALIRILKLFILPSDSK